MVVKWGQVRSWLMLVIAVCVSGQSDMSQDLACPLFWRVPAFGVSLPAQPNHSPTGRSKSNLPMKAKGPRDTEAQCQEIIRHLKSLANPDAVKGMARYGINPATAYGVSIPELRKIAATAKKNHTLAEMLWSSGIHEARILASMVDNPKQITDEQMEQWAKDFNSWDLCDQCCNNLFRKVEHAHEKAREWRQAGRIRQKGGVCSDGLPGCA